jgi:hypothetical protein
MGAPLPPCRLLRRLLRLPGGGSRSLLRRRGGGQLGWLRGRAVGAGRGGEAVDAAHRGGSLVTGGGTWGVGDSCWGAVGRSAMASCVLKIEDLGMGRIR